MIIVDTNVLLSAILEDCLENKTKLLTFDQALQKHDRVNCISPEECIGYQY